MTWFHQTTSHCLHQYWPRSMSPYGVSRPQWVKVFSLLVACHLQPDLMTPCRLRHPGHRLHHCDHLWSRGGGHCHGATVRAGRALRTGRGVGGTEVMDGIVVGFWGGRTAVGVGVWRGELGDELRASTGHLVIGMGPGIQTQQCGEVSWETSWGRVQDGYLVIGMGPGIQKQQGGVSWETSWGRVQDGYLVIGMGPGIQKQQGEVSWETSWGRVQDGYLVIGMGPGIQTQLEQLERLRSEDTPRRLMITHTIESCWIPSQNKVKWPWRYRSRSRVITCDTPSHASDHLYQIWKESIRNCRCYRAYTIFKAKAKWPWRCRSRSKVIICNTPSHTSDHLC